MSIRSVKKKNMQLSLLVLDMYYIAWLNGEITEDDLHGESYLYLGYFKFRRSIVQLFKSALAYKQLSKLQTNLSIALKTKKTLLNDLKSKISELREQEATVMRNLFEGKEILLDNIDYNRISPSCKFYRQGAKIIFYDDKNIPKGNWLLRHLERNMSKEDIDSLGRSLHFYFNKDVSDKFFEYLKFTIYQLTRSDNYSTYINTINQQDFDFTTLNKQIDDAISELRDAKTAYKMMNAKATLWAQIAVFTMLGEAMQEIAEGEQQWA